ncbi:glycosyltransferase [Salinisphaera sp. Q1T1-3]|uniref:glycosyltransferase n=1 Tax=Salinisphaera sp. Q1T1-3 TaxID=2321229 RepID=UPI001314CDDC|nr:glycosyltransferase [Salinisphaera sp. Q1T1-3]
MDDKPDAESRRIVFCLPALAQGGMERATLMLAEALCEHGCAVDILLERRVGGYLADVAPAVGLHALHKGAKWAAYAALIRAWPRFGTSQWLRWLVGRRHYLPIRRLPSLAAYLKRTRPDVMFVSHGRMPILAILAVRMAGLSTRIVIIEHSTLSRWLEVFTDQPEKHDKWRYRVELARRFYPFADRIVGVSHGVTEDLTRLLGLAPSKTGTIYNPVRLPEPTSLRPPAHPWFDTPRACPLIVAVGRLVSEKDFALLIDAFAELRRHQAARLMIIGEGEERASLEARIAALGLSADVVLPGWWADAQAAMAHSDLFVLSSRFEGLGLVLIEAMAVGCPVVSVDCPSGPREILDNGRYGTLVPMAEPVALSRAMTAMLAAPTSADTLRARAAQFSTANAVHEYMRLIASVTADGQAGEETLT